MAAIAIREATAHDASAVASLLVQLGYPNTPGEVRDRMPAARLRP